MSLRRLFDCLQTPNVQDASPMSPSGPLRMEPVYTGKTRSSSLSQDFPRVNAHAMAYIERLATIAAAYEPPQGVSVNRPHRNTQNGFATPKLGGDADTAETNANQAWNSLSPGPGAPRLADPTATIAGSDRDRRGSYTRRVPAALSSLDSEFQSETMIVVIDKLLGSAQSRRDAAPTAANSSSALLSA